eukprot:GHRR01027994.1.p1 GENE.GHRR01027994.1~~GHRR01027994.1.p1  ORF type:complete len:463 (+),score=161.35 GHRR01027994.1:639-2027(+)
MLCKKILQHVASHAGLHTETVQLAAALSSALSTATAANSTSNSSAVICSSYTAAKPDASCTCNRTWWTALGAAIMAVAAAATPALADSSPAGKPIQSKSAAGEEGDGVTSGGGLLSLSIKQRIFFKYEKRIRDLSTLEKIYDYFATHEKDGYKVMSSHDVARALVPTYPPVGTNVVRAGFLEGERGHSQEAHDATDQLLTFFDHDKDGSISFNEFLLIVVCLSVPEKDVEVVFDVMDLDDNGLIDKDEFLKVLQQLERRAGIQQGFHSRVGKHSAVNVNAREITHTLFQEAGKDGVDLSKFRAFLNRLQDSMLRLEFAHYNTGGKGTVSGQDFANSLVTAADVKEVDAMLNKVERPLPKQDFAKLLFKTMGAKLSPAVLDIVYYVFGDGDGMLDGPCFVDVMKRRNRVPGYRKGQALAVVTPEDEQPHPHSWFGCIKDCIFGAQDHHRYPKHPPKQEGQQQQ